jgi:virulence-associated protein VapD
MYSYKNCRDNYYNLNNINTIIKNDKRNEILNTLNDKENGAIIPGEEDSNITNYMNELYQQNIDSEINKISISNKFFNNYDLRVLVQMPLKYLRFLDLENNSISQIDCLKKSDFANLVILNLNNNAIKDILPLENASFKDNLQALFLRNNCIKDISVFKKKCASLRQLDLRNNCIDDISVFDSMKDYLANLQSLYLANNAFDKNQFENAIKNIKELTEKDIE